MRRVLAWTLVPAAAGLLLWTASSPARPCVSPTSCKPEAPIVVTVQTDGASAGVVRASVGIRPVLELSELRWTWELSPDVRLVDGEAAGSGEPARGALTEREVALQLPDDGRHHTASLVVTGLLAHGGEEGQPEPVTVVRTLSWGRPDPVTPVIWSPDADTGALAEVAVVPTTHVPAQPSGAGGR